MLSLRWALFTASGKNLRVYAENRLLAIKVVRSQFPEERILHVEPAGHWFRCRVEGCGGLNLPDWEQLGQITGWPGGPSGRPS